MPMDDTDETPGSAQVWHERLNDYARAVEKWHGQCDRLEKLYSKVDRADTADREYSLFWANLEVLKPAVYARPPIPVVVPRFKDGNPLAREASDLLERCCIVMEEQADIDGVLRLVRDDYLMYGRGTSWLRIAGNDDEVAIDHVPHVDFAHDPARSWLTVKWVARRAWMTRAEGRKRFGETFFDVPLKRDKRADDRGDDAYISRDKVAVWEIWCKESGKVYFVAEDHKEILEEQAPWFDLRGFFPCPKPCYGTLVPGSLRPVPEIVQYKDQIEEINEYTARIAAVSETLRLKGFYPAGSGDLREAIETAVRSIDNRAMLVPISSFAALGGGSFKDSIVWMPIGEAVALVQTLVELRRVVIEDVYQITGISDIVRGQTQASETATAQQIKSQWGSIRIRERQQELVRFARDVIRIMAEIIAENFEPGLMMEMAQSQLPTEEQQQQAMMFLQQVQEAQQMAPMAQQMGIEVPPPPPRDQLKMAEKAVKSPTMEAVTQFLRNDRARGFMIEVESDSTIQPNEDDEKSRRIEFVTAIGGLFQQAAPLVMQAPILGPFAMELMKFAAGAFRAGRPLEMVIDRLGEQIEDMAEQASQPPPPPQPDPIQEQKIRQEEAKTEAIVTKAQGDIVKTQMGVQAHSTKTQNDIVRMQTEAVLETMTPGVNSVRGGV
jgi:hypothetical protein